MVSCNSLLIAHLVLFVDGSLFTWFAGLLSVTAVCICDAGSFLCFYPAWTISLCGSRGYFTLCFMSTPCCIAMLQLLPNPCTLRGIPICYPFKFVNLHLMMNVWSIRHNPSHPSKILDGLARTMCHVQKTEPTSLCAFLSQEIWNRCAMTLLLSLGCMISTNIHVSFMFNERSLYKVLSCDKNLLGQPSSHLITALLLRIYCGKMRTVGVVDKDKRRLREKHAKLSLKLEIWRTLKISVRDLFVNCFQ